MRKFQLLFFLGTVLPLVVSAQLGIKAGVTLGGTYGSSEEFDGEKIESIDPALGYQFGIMATLLDLKAFRLNAELLYEDRRGVKEATFRLAPSQDTEVDTDIEFKNSFQYISVPLLASFGGKGLNVYIGPSISYLLSATSETTTTTTTSGGSTTLEEEIDLVDDYDNPFIERLNIAGNLGVMVPILPKASLDIRVYHTITDVTNDDEDRSIIDRITRPQDVRLRDDKDATVGIQANLVIRF